MKDQKEKKSKDERSNRDVRQDVSESIAKGNKSWSV